MFCRTVGSLEEFGRFGPLEKFADVGSLQKAIWCEKEVFWPSGNTASKHVGLQWDVLEIFGQTWPSTASLTCLW
jgi:hypothetical protein